MGYEKANNLKVEWFLDKELEEVQIFFGLFKLILKK